MKRLALAAALLALAHPATLFLAGDGDDARHLSARMSVERAVDGAPDRPAFLIIGDSTGAADVDRHLLARRLGGGLWLQLSTVADLSPKLTADLVERYVLKHGPPAAVLVVHSFPTWYLHPPKDRGFSERVARASALVRLGETAGAALGAPSLRRVERAVRGAPSRHWRRILGRFPTESQESSGRLSRLSREFGFPLVFIETPVTAGLLNDGEREKRAEARRLLSSLGHPYVVLVDEAEPQYMADEMHMTPAGRRRFTERLAQSLSVSGLRTPIGLPAISRRP